MQKVGRSVDKGKTKRGAKGGKKKKHLMVVHDDSEELGANAGSNQAGIEVQLSELQDENKAYDVQHVAMQERIEYLERAVAVLMKNEAAVTAARETAESAGAAASSAAETAAAMERVVTNMSARIVILEDQVADLNWAIDDLRP